MPVISEQLPNLMNGVSQQATTMRLPSQAERQVNGMSSVVEGVYKRLPLRHVSKIMDGAAGDVHVHMINRDLSERYVVMVFNGSIKVFDLQGNEKTVTYPNGTGYITTATPSSTIRTITLADHTFIVNTDKVVAKDAAVSPSTPGQNWAFIRAVNYDTTYKVEIDGVEQASYTTADAYGTDPKVSVDEVVDALTTQLTTNLGAGWTVTSHAPVITIVKDDGTAFDLATTDTNGNSMINTIDGKVQRFTDLPVVGNHGYIVRVIGDVGSDTDDYYLKFEANKGSGHDTGVWVETVAPGIQTAFDATTMPHSLVRMPDGSFELRSIDWDARECGTEDTAKWPSFTGKTIRDIFYDQNRLCFLSDDDVIMSRARSLFAFFRETATTQLDTDPIDVTAAGSKVSTLEFAVPFNKQIVVFSGQTQFVVDAETLLASKPPGVKEVTAYEIDGAARPIAVGRKVFFSVKSGDYSRLMEFYTVGETETTDAADVTKHVPKYVPADAFKLAASPTDEVVLALNKTERNKVYVYKYYWRGEQKLQSSWSHWELRSDAEVLNVEFIGDDAYFVTQYTDGLYLETVSVSDGVVEVGEPFVTRLDRLVSEADSTAVFDSGTNTTTLTLPYQPTADVEVVTRPDTAPEAPVAYQKLTVVSVTGNDVVVTGDHTATKFYAGEPYVFEYEFSEAILKTQGPGGGTASALAGRLQINRWLVAFWGTGFFTATVETANGGTYSYDFTGTVLGTSSAVIGQASIAEGNFAFRVNTDSRAAKITLTNNTFLPCYFTAAEWEGRFERRTSRA